MRTSTSAEIQNRTRGPGTLSTDSRVARPETREIDVSVLVPAKDEAGNLPLFMEQAADAFAGSPVRYEVIVIDDGSEDDTWALLQDLAAQYHFLRLARHRVRRGIADALRRHGDRSG